MPRPFRSSRGHRCGGGRSRAGLALAVVAGTLLGGLAAPSARADPLPAGAPVRGFAVSLNRLTPAVLTPSTPLTVTGTISNDAGGSLAGARVVLGMHRERLESRLRVQDWHDGTISSANDRVLPGAVAVQELPAGDSRSFRVTVPAGRLGLTSESSFGPRGITVQLRRAGRTLASVRSVVVWSPDFAYRPTSLTLLAPVTPSTASADAGAATPEAAEDLAAGGRLDRVISATQDPAIAWAVDPSVLMAAEALRAGGRASDPAASTAAAATSSDPTADPTAGPGSRPEDAAAKAGRQWLTRVREGVVGRAVIGLPYADPDLNSVLRNKGAPLLGMTSDLGRAATRETLGTDLDTGVAWPGDGRVVRRSVSALSRAGYGSVLIAAGTQPVQGGYGTATGRSTLSGGGRTVQGLLYDESLSALAAGSGGPDPVLTTQQLLAQLAAITLELPAVPRHLLAVMPRTWDPDPGQAAAMVAALRSAPWVRLAPLSQLRAQPPVPQRADPTYPQSAKARELPPGQISRALVLHGRLDRLEPALTDGDAVLTPYRRWVASLLSVAWRRDLDAVEAPGPQVSQRVDALVDGVELVVGSRRKWFTAKSSVLTLYVRNRTPHDLNLLVDLKASTGQLSVKPVNLVARANTRTSFAVPARAVANGDVEVSATLQNPGGGALEGTRTFVVRSRPDWETRGIIGTAGVLGLLLLVGLVRGVRRARTREPVVPAPDLDDLAVEQQRAELAGARPGAGPGHDG